MADSEKKKAWMAANTVMVMARLNRNTDGDIFDYYGDRIPAATVKEGLRAYMKMHPKDSEPGK